MRQYSSGGLIDLNYEFVNALSKTFFPDINWNLVLVPHRGSYQAYRHCVNCILMHIIKHGRDAWPSRVIHDGIWRLDALTVQAGLCGESRRKENHNHHVFCHFLSEVMNEYAGFTWSR